jgi:hypothetical protein
MKRPELNLDPIEQKQKDAARRPWMSPWSYELLTESIPLLIKEIRYLRGRINDLMLGCEVDDIPHKHGGIL